MNQGMNQTVNHGCERRYACKAMRTCCRPLHGICPRLLQRGECGVQNVDWRVAHTGASLSTALRPSLPVRTLGCVVALPAFKSASLRPASVGILEVLALPVGLAAPASTLLLQPVLSFLVLPLKEAKILVSIYTA